MPPASLVRRIAGIALRRPSLWPRLLVAAWRFRARDWYRRSPFLPVPPAEYLAWRLHTAYGEDGAEPDADAIDRYLRWTSAMNRMRR